jgi:hypothetical protein
MTANNLILLGNNFIAGALFGAVEAANKNLPPSRGFAIGGTTLLIASLAEKAFDAISRYIATNQNWRIINYRYAALSTGLAARVGIIAIASSLGIFSPSAALLLSGIATIKALSFAAVYRSRPVNQQPMRYLEPSDPRPLMQSILRFSSLMP